MQFLLVSALSALLALHAAGQMPLMLVLDDPLDGSTKGVQREGEFVTGGGWRAVGKQADIVYELPRALGPDGAVEFQVRNLNPPAQADSGETFLIGLWETIGDAGGDRNVPSNDCFYMYAGTKYPQFKLKFHTHGFSRHEKNYEPFASFDPARTYTLRFEWRGRLFQVLLDGAPFLKWEGPVSDPHDRVKFIQLGARNNAQPQPALRGPIYSNLKAWTTEPSDRRSPVGLHAAGAGAAFVKLAWDPPYDGHRVTGYAVYRDGRLIGETAAERFFLDQELAEGRYRYEVAARLAEGGESARGQALAVTIVRPSLTAARIAPAPRIDGKLNESAWKLSAPVLRILDGEPDNRVAAGALYDAENLYLAVRVLDADVRADAERPLEGDAVEILIDGNNNGAPKNWRQRQFDEFDRQLIVQPGGRQLRLKQGKGKLEPAGAAAVQHANARVDGGYTVEMAIPWATLGIQPQAGQTIGLDIRQYDGDAGRPRSVLGWMSESQQSTITSAYGDLVLGGSVSAPRAGR